jgi:hypothetical protein
MIRDILERLFSRPKLVPCKFITTYPASPMPNLPCWLRYIHQERADMEMARLNTEPTNEQQV